jgi:hypothetical protein
MIAEHNQGAYSARVNMELIVSGSSISVTHMGPDFILIEPSDDHPPGEATLVLQVDQSERHWQVKLPDGIPGGSKRVALTLAEVR